MNVLVNLDWSHVRVLDVEGRPLSDVTPESGHLACVELLGLKVALLQDLVLVLPGVEIFTTRLDVKLGTN